MPCLCSGVMEAVLQTIGLARAALTEAQTLLLGSGPYPLPVVQQSDCLKSSHRVVSLRALQTHAFVTEWLWNHVGQACAVSVVRMCEMCEVCFLVCRLQAGSVACRC